WTGTSTIFARSWASGAGRRRFVRCGASGTGSNGKGVRRERAPARCGAHAAVHARGLDRARGLRAAGGRAVRRGRGDGVAALARALGRPHPVATRRLPRLDQRARRRHAVRARGPARRHGRPGRDHPHYHRGRREAGRLFRVARHARETARRPAGVAAETRAIGPAELGTRLTSPTGQAEVTELADSVNRMLERVDRAHRALEAFTADASHELRTPLTHLRAQVQWAAAEGRSEA